MRILFITYRYGKDIAGGGERFIRELATRLALRGHQVRVITTCSRFLMFSPNGYLVWDNFLPAGIEMDSGVEVQRFRVSNPSPWKGARLARKLQTYLDKERDSEQFLRLLKNSIRGTSEHCLSTGWYHLERWAEGPARWTGKQASLVVGGSGISSLCLTLYCPWGVKVKVSVDDAVELKVELLPGEKSEVEISFPPRDTLGLTLKCDRVFRPPGDGRLLGVAVREISILDESAIRGLSLDRDWTLFTRTAPEEVLGEIMWPLALKRPSRYEKLFAYLMGPRSKHMEKAALEAAYRCDLVIGAMVPLQTLVAAQRISKKANKPFLAIPLFHPRDMNHYWSHFRVAMSGAAGVEANSPVIRSMMEGWGFPAFSIGPGLDVEEFTSPDIDGERFRREHGIGNSPMLLWVGRKNEDKGYPVAVKTVCKLRKDGIPAVLVMIGPDDDGRPLSSEGVIYLGTLPREKLLDAYDACDVFIFPSLHESFCLVFCEAWLRGKPVLGNAYCAAARGQIEHGVDGFLCRDLEDYVRFARFLLTNKGEASKIGFRGREKIVAQRNWGDILDRYEEKIYSLCENEDCKH